MKKESLVRIIKKLPGYFLKKKLLLENFTIISNNCWGGEVYDYYGLEYKTPTVGMWFHSKEYLKFLSNLEHYLKCELKEISWKECHFSSLLQKREAYYIKALNKRLPQLVIGRLDDIDIVFLHYNSFKEAEQKWNRRKRRINFENIIVKYNDQNGFIPENFIEFEQLPYKNKIFFTALNKYKTTEGTKVVVFDEYKEAGYVVDDINFKKFNITEYLNNLKKM